MRVLLVSGERPGPGAGGIGTVARAIADAADQDVTILCAGSERTEMGDVVTLPSRGAGLVGMFDFGRSVRKFLEGHGDEFDVIHFHFPSVGPLVCCPREHLDSSIVTFHTTAAGYKKHLYRVTPFQELTTREKVYKIGYIDVHEQIERYAIRRAGTAPVITAVSSGIATELKDEYGVSADAVVPNGVEPRREGSDARGSPERERSRILAVGRLVAQKGFERGIEALARVRSPFSLTIAGTGPRKESLESTCVEYGIGATFPGYVSDSRLHELYEAADVLLMPSRYEGLPMVGLEGAHHGLPIAGFELCRMGDVLCPENQRYIVENGQVANLADRIRSLLERPRKATQIGKRNRDRVRNQYGVKNMVSRYVDLYSEVKR